MYCILTKYTVADHTFLGRFTVATKNLANSDIRRRLGRLGVRQKFSVISRFALITN